MKFKFQIHIRHFLLAGALVMLPGVGCNSGSQHSDHHGHDDHADHEEAEKGPHGGWMLHADGRTIEITIYEKGIDPEFRVYAYVEEQQVQPDDFSVTVDLIRLGDKQQNFTFTAERDYMLGNQVVEEPHSFDIKVSATVRGESITGVIEQREGRVSIPDRIRKSAGITVERAENRVIQDSIQLPARVDFDGDRIAHVYPRYAGIVKDVAVHLGDRVKRGMRLVSIENNETLTTYDLRSELDGVVVEKHVAIAESVSTRSELFVLADLRTVWVEVQIPVDRMSEIAPGASVSVEIEGVGVREGKLAHISAKADQHTQSVEAHAEIGNADGQLRPGTFGSARLYVGQPRQSVAVKETALQRFRDWTVVFVSHGDEFEIQPVEVGAKSGGWVEVLSGLSAGQPYVATGSYVLKADAQKEGASHDH